MVVLGFAECITDLHPAVPVAQPVTLPSSLLLALHDHSLSLNTFKKKLKTHLWATTMWHFVLFSCHDTSVISYLLSVSVVRGSQGKSENFKSTGVRKTKGR